MPTVARIGPYRFLFSNEPRAEHVLLDDDELTVELTDGRRISVPLAWFPKLLHAKESQRRKWRLVGDGRGIHWPLIDEDLGVVGLLLGARVPSAAARHSRR